MENIKKKKNVHLNTEQFVSVDDNWYGNYEGDKIRVSISLNWMPSLNYHFVRVGAWGNDDFGMIKDFEDENYTNLLKKYHELCENFFDSIPKTTNQEWFQEQGFEVF